MMNQQWSTACIGREECNRGKLPFASKAEPTKLDRETNLLRLRQAERLSDLQLVEQHLHHGSIEFRGTFMAEVRASRTKHVVNASLGTGAQEEKRVLSWHQRVMQATEQFVDIRSLIVEFFCSGRVIARDDCSDD